MSQQLQKSLLMCALCFIAALEGLFAQDVFINELHYDNVGTDENEGVELAGPAGTDFNGWQLVPYNGSTGSSYSTLALTGTIPNQSSGFGTLFFQISGLQNGAPDGIALVNASGETVQFLSYEGSFIAADGPAAGMSSIDIGVEEPGDTPLGFSLQLSGSGNTYADFSWVAPASATFTQSNNNQTFVPLEDVVFMNEIHYDNAGADIQEGVEIAGNAGADLTSWALVAYNGSNGAVYDSIGLEGIIPDQQNGYGTLFFTMEGLQNGSPDGIALVNPEGLVVQFLSYEGTLTAVGGPADGLESTDIGVEEVSSTPVDFSLQLTGKGFSYNDFIWSGPIAKTYNAINAGQSFGEGDPDPDPEPQELSIAAARQQPLGTEVIISGTLTVSDQLGGPAFIQDSTGGIAVFDPQIHKEGLYVIGDSLRIAASIGAFNQQVQLIDVTNVAYLGAASLGAGPELIEIEDLDNREGQLVTISGAFFPQNKGLLFPESNYLISDGTGEMELRIDADVDSLVGREIPDDTVSITGVLGSFRGVLQILPRFIEDLPGTEPYLPIGSDIPVSSTLDVMTWNMEFFGATLPNFGPPDVELQLENARKLLDSVRADIIAVQEVSDTAALDMLIENLPGYAKICSDRYSYSFNGPDPEFPSQQLCFIYDTTAIEILNARVLFEAMYDGARDGVLNLLHDYPTGDPSSFWSSGRLPYMITAEAMIEGSLQTIQFINIHAKSGSGNEDIARKRYDIRALKDTLDMYYSNANIILLGDYNDDVDESIGGGVTPYEQFVNDTSYTVVTSSLSEEGLRSYIFNDNVIDHITISNELNEAFIEGTETLFIPFALIENYANTTSDHLPVLSRFNFASPLVVAAGNDAVVYAGYDPLACTTLSAGAVTGGTAPYSYSWDTGVQGPSIEVCPEENRDYILTVTDSNGLTASDTVSVCVIDVSCGRKEGSQKVQVCINRPGVTGKERTFCVPKIAVKPLLARGATLGGCNIGCGQGVEAAGSSVDWSDFVVYPNPVADQIQINFDAPVSGVIEFTLFNYLGQEIFKKKAVAEAGYISFDLAAFQLKRQFYYLKVGNGKEEKMVRILKK